MPLLPPLLLKTFKWREEALAAIEKAISLQPDNANYYSEKGTILAKLERDGAAEEAFNQALSINPGSSFYNNRGILYFNQAKLELALSDYDKAIELDPNYAPAYGSLGALHIELGNIKKARFNLEKAQQLFTAQGNTAGAEQVEAYIQKFAKWENHNR